MGFGINTRGWRICVGYWEGFTEVVDGRFICTCILFSSCLLILAVAVA